MIDRLTNLKSLVNEERVGEDYSWLSQSDANDARFEVRTKDRAVPIEEVQRIYTVRAKINENNGHPIFGFEKLLRNLAISRIRHVVIHLMQDTADREYFVFTDPNVEELLGILGPLHVKTDFER